jgi:hypothetical protein
VIGARAAKASGDTTPLQMTAVLTTHAKALTSATPGDVVSGPGDVPVFLVTMRGNLWQRRPPGRPEQRRPPAVTCPSWSAPAPSRCSTPASASSPPPVSPASLGPVTYLAGHPH